VFPKFTEKYDAGAKKLFFKDGTSLDADMVIISIGEKPVLDFLPPEIHTERGYIVVNDLGQTSDVKVFAIGDATKPGLVTNAIGQGKVAADVINAQLMNTDYVPEERRVIPYEKVKTEYYEVCRQVFGQKRSGPLHELRLLQGLRHVRAVLLLRRHFAQDAAEQVLRVRGGRGPVHRLRLLRRHLSLRRLGYGGEYIITMAAEQASPSNLDMFLHRRPRSLFSPNSKRLTPNCHGVVLH
jgi:hypothetical protein